MSKGDKRSAAAAVRELATNAARVAYDTAAVGEAEVEGDADDDLRRDGGALLTAAACLAAGAVALDQVARRREAIAETDPEKREVVVPCADALV